MSRRTALGRTLRIATLASAVALAIPLAAASAQDYNPLPEGLRFTFQTGFAFSTLVEVDPAGEQQFGRHRATPITLRVTHNLIGPLVGFVEGGSAERGSKVTSPGTPDAVYRTRWWDLAGGLTAVGQCVASVCPSLDAGVVLARNRQSLLYNESDGRPLGTIGVARYETSAIVGVRLAIPRLRGAALVVRHQEGLTNLPTNDSKARSRSQSLMISVPLTQ